MNTESECLHRGATKKHFIAKDYISRRQYTVCECLECGLSFTDTSTHEQSTTDKSVYPSSYYGTTKRYRLFFGQVLNYLVMRRVKLLGNSAQKQITKAALDIGCGQGFFLKYYNELGWKTVGIEVSSEAAFHARELLGLDVRLGTRATEELEDASFDVICIWHVLEHVVCPKSLLGEACRLIKNDGKLILSVPNFGSLEARLGKSNWFHLDVPRHLTHFTEDTLRDCLDSTGWKIVRKSYFTPEYDFFSFIQTVQNMLGFDMNLFYRMIRSEDLASGTLTSTTLLQRALVAASAPLLALLSIVYVPLVNTFRQGSSINLVLEKCHAER